MAIRYQPAYGMSYEALAECRLARGDLTGALAALRKGQETAPKDGSLRLREAAVLLKLGSGTKRSVARAPKPRGFFRRSLELDPRFGPARARLVEIR